MREQKSKKKIGTHTKTCVANVYCLSPSLSVFNRTREWLFFSLSHVVFFLFFFSFTDLILQFWYFTLHCIQFLSSIYSVCSYRHTFICIFSHFYVTVRCLILYRLYFVYSFDYIFVFGHAYTHFTIAYLYKWHSNAYFRHVRCRQNDS